MRLMALGNLRFELRAGITLSFMVIAPIRRPFRKQKRSYDASMAQELPPMRPALRRAKEMPFKTD
jgi:hypothetical protein